MAIQHVVVLLRILPTNISCSTKLPNCSLRKLIENVRMESKIDITDNQATQGRPRSRNYDEIIEQARMAIICARNEAVFLTQKDLCAKIGITQSQLRRALVKTGKSWGSLIDEAIAKNNEIALRPLQFLRNGQALPFEEVIRSILRPGVPHECTWRLYKNLPEILSTHPNVPETAELFMELLTKLLLERFPNSAIDDCEQANVEPALQFARIQFNNFQSERASRKV
jgi:hypothetical protein